VPQVEHLNMIQGVIGRLAQNSFVVKGWSITLTAALLGFAAKDHDTSFAWIAFGAAAVFALIDAWYLANERKYVHLYARAVEPNSTVGWSLDAGRPGSGDVLTALFSWSVLLPHSTAVLAALGVALFG
jgi:hypothetical protein